MFSLRNFWRRHRRKIFVTAGVFGSGYLLYKLYGAYKRRLDVLEGELTLQRENEELIKAQMQAHFENIQMISDTITLPHAMHYLSCRIAEDLDLSQLLERLIQGKGQPNTLTSSEKLELWDRLKILSFTRMALSVWATTMLSLYVKVQVNILGRLLYIDTARSLGGSNLMENRDIVDREDQQKFLGSVDFLSQYGIPSLVFGMELATKEALKGKQLRDFFNSKALHETIMQILNTFMSRGSPHSWVKYMMPEAFESPKTASSSSVDPIPSDTIGLDQLMAEARAVLTSAEFGNVVEISLKAVLDALIELMVTKFGGGNLTSGVPLAKLLPQIAHMCPLLFEELSKNQFIQTIRNLPEVEIFFTLLYANVPSA
ncbi:peroxisome biogenesis protein 3-2 isoform X2 [Neltuma alba]|uniref:peroxisome biogenesis protein 3-2 isoform X2 n=1 Tax=Neltuma alba TaxID=207710 RepID=UPI0010A38894|nr:peroxisome biogenesis protein 3-2-like isoform X2 [Prosopis alba]